MGGSQECQFLVLSLFLDFYFFVIEESDRESFRLIFLLSKTDATLHRYMDFYSYR